jgi:uncharacterized protein (TIGR03032 family)
MGTDMGHLASTAPPAKPAVRTLPQDVEHEYTLSWPIILSRLNTSLLISTYQAGKVIAVSSGSPTDRHRLRLSFHNFEKAMGIAAAPGRLAIGGRSLVWILRDSPSIAPHIEPNERYDACYLTRTALYTGEIDGHELAWAEDELWAVNTRFSCICTLDDRHSFVPRWKPPFVSGYAPEDRCHLNGFALVGGKPRYATCFGVYDHRTGWRADKSTGGCLLEVPSGAIMAEGLAMPHSPRVHQGAVWLLDSGSGRLMRLNQHNGSLSTIATLPGYTRGLAFAGSLAFVGLSRIRDGSTFSGVPIAADAERLKCGVAIVDTTNGETIGLLEFHTGVSEIFDIQLLSGVRSPALRGPFPDIDDQTPIWLAPPPAPY